MKSTKRFAVIGYGAIGQEIAGAVRALDEADTLAVVLVRPDRQADGFAVTHDVAGLIAARPQLVLECAGHGAVIDYGAQVLAAGLDLAITSIGALADDAFVAELRRAADAGGGKLFLAPGAVAGLDGLVGARLAGLREVTYTSFKPPHAWRGTAAEAVLDLDHPEAEQVFFQGSAREAAQAYPKNANVAVTVGLCGLGIDATKVRLVSSRKVSDPLGLIEAEGAFGRFTFDIFARASPSNPKTSALTAFSLLQCARIGIGLDAFALLDSP